MSSSSTSTAAATSSPSPTQSGDSGAAKGANYFFGFLITFIALLFIFIGCGVTTRRRLQRRRIINLDALASMPGFFGSRAGLVIDENDKPLLCERWTERAEEPTWTCMQPLSVSNVTAKTLVSDHSPPVRLPSRNPNAINGLSLPTWAHPPTKPVLDSAATVDETLLQISVMITMPHDKGVEDEIPEYQIGVAQLPTT
ncbi:hypothetical protein BDZ89DRAFT_1158816 [Hymenopellis radicata]|nr:hypothetical protein BDZ89DRAFT_1158816 [Hymenopellis radicata]